ncbi:hypothetical protein N665_0123s0033 [Sinapis alba]|nr:hypothetical protein N665_0123s0033 [Sinapis alba]
MARLVLVVKGQWSMNQQEVWKFNQDPTVDVRDILVRVDESIDLRALVRFLFGIRTETPLVVTFMLPPWMVGHEGDTIPSKNIDTNIDVEIMMGAHHWNTEPKLCIMIGAEEVARYQFVCRTTFTIGDRTFLSEGVTEEQHMSTINGNETKPFFWCIAT